MARCVSELAVALGAASAAVDGRPFRLKLDPQHNHQRADLSACYLSACKRCISSYICRNKKVRYMRKRDIAMRRCSVHHMGWGNCRRHTGRIMCTPPEVQTASLSSESGQGPGAGILSCNGAVRTPVTHVGWCTPPHTDLYHTDL